MLGRKLVALVLHGAEELEDVGAARLLDGLQHRDLAFGDARVHRRREEDVRDAREGRRQRLGRVHVGHYDVEVRRLQLELAAVAHHGAHLHAFIAEQRGDETVTEHAVAGRDEDLVFHRFPPCEASPTARPDSIERRHRTSGATLQTTFPQGAAAKHPRSQPRLPVATGTRRHPAYAMAP